MPPLFSETSTPSSLASHSSNTPLSTEDDVDIFFTLEVVIKCIDWIKLFATCFAVRLVFVALIKLNISDWLFKPNTYLERFLSTYNCNASDSKD